MKLLSRIRRKHKQGKSDMGEIGKEHPEQRNKPNYEVNLPLTESNSNLL